MKRNKNDGRKICCYITIYYRESSTSGECCSGSVVQRDIDNHLINDCVWKSNNYSYIPDNGDGCLEDGYLMSQGYEENSLLWNRNMISYSSHTFQKNVPTMDRLISRKNWRWLFQFRFRSIVGNFVEQSNFLHESGWDVNDFILYLFYIKLMILFSFRNFVTLTNGFKSLL